MCTLVHFLSCNNDVMSDFNEVIMQSEKSLLSSFQIILTYAKLFCDRKRIAAGACQGFAILSFSVRIRICNVTVLYDLLLPQSSPSIVFFFVKILKAQSLLCWLSTSAVMPLCSCSIWEGETSDQQVVKFLPSSFVSLSLSLSLSLSFFLSLFLYCLLLLLFTHILRILTTRTLMYLQAILVVLGSAPLRKSCLHSGMPWGAVRRRGPVTTDTLRFSRPAGTELAPSGNFGISGSAGWRLSSAAGSCSSLLRPARTRFRLRRPRMYSSPNRARMMNTAKADSRTRRKRFAAHSMINELLRIK